MATDTPFHLKGNFAPVEEELTVTELRVEGEIPAELSGLYCRNGSNPHTGFSEHWFLGDGMVHGVRLEGGKASWYRNRYVRTPYLDDPDAPRRDEAGKPFRENSFANTHVIGHAGQILALEEGSFPFVLDHELETIGPMNYEGKLVTAMTAHPKICGKTGELLFFGYDQLPPYLTYHRVSKEGKLVQSEEITVGGPTMMHDFAITERHVLFLDLPVVFDIEIALKGGMPFQWSDTYPARIGVMPREGGDADVQWFEVEPCYVFHGLNAYDEGDKVVFDACRSNEVFRGGGSMEIDPSDGPGGQLSFHRFELDRKTGGVHEQTIDPRSCEFPRLADAMVGQKHRYGYMLQLAAGDDGPSLGGSVKVDVETGTMTPHDYGEGRSSGEPVFVSAAGADPASDEGYVMSFVYDENRNGSDFVIVDGQDMQTEIARVELPQRVPFGFHGSWIADE